MFRAVDFGIVILNPDGKEDNTPLDAVWEDFPYTFVDINKNVYSIVSATYACNSKVSRSDNIEDRIVS